MIAAIIRQEIKSQLDVQIDWLAKMNMKVGKISVGLYYLVMKLLLKQYGSTRSQGLKELATETRMKQFETWKEVASCVYYLSKEGKNIYRSIISFERATARELDLIQQKDWQQYIEAHIATLAEKNGIKSRTRALPALPMASGTTPNPNVIRVQLIKDTFAARIREYYTEKDAARAAVRDITDKEVAEFEQYIKEARPKDYERIKDWFETFDEDAIYADPVYGVFNDKSMLPLVKMLFEIKAMIPQDGRITYKLLPEEVETKIDELVIAILKNSAGLRRAVKRYVKSKM